MRRLLPVLTVSVLLGVTTAPARAATAAPVPFAAKAAAAASPSSGGAGGGQAEGAGKRLGDVIKGWGGALLLAVAGLMGIGALVKRNVAEGLTLLVLVIVLGGFVFADQEMKGLIASIWKTIGG
jgi:hypothetical protein